MNRVHVAEFLLFVLIVVVLAWEHHPKGRMRAPARLIFREWWRFFTFLWVVGTIAYWWCFWHYEEAWPLFWLLVEIAGVTYLAREVFQAQQFEELQRFSGDAKPLVDLEYLADAGKLDDYVHEYYRLSGSSRAEADQALAGARAWGTLAKEVAELRANARRIHERPRGVVGQLMLKYRRARLQRGLILVVLGLTGHGAYGIISHSPSACPSDAGAPPAGPRLDELESLGRRIEALERTDASHTASIAEIIAEDKRWHVKRKRSVAAPQTTPGRCCCGCGTATPRPN